jgi:hypothetical protein
MQKASSSDYFKSLKELVVFMKEPANNHWFFEFSIFFENCGYTSKLVFQKNWQLASKWVYNRVDNPQLSIAHSNSCPTLVKPSEDFFECSSRALFWCPFPPKCSIFWRLYIPLVDNTQGHEGMSGYYKKNKPYHAGYEGRYQCWAVLTGGDSVLILVFSPIFKLRSVMYGIWWESGWKPTPKFSQEKDSAVYMIFKKKKKTETQVPIWVEPGSNSQANK